MSPTVVANEEQAERQPLLPNTESKEIKRERADKIALNGALRGRSCKMCAEFPQ
jgi:hypothetical protein